MTTSKNSIIDQLVEHALLEYSTSPNPRKFAEDAAHIVTTTAAKKLHNESAYSAAFVASAKSASFMFQRSKNLAVIATLKTKEYNIAKECQATFLRQTSKFEPTALQFDPILNDLSKGSSFGHDTNEAYHHTFLCEKSNLALEAASTIYLHAYSSAYAAYVHADAVATVQSPDKGNGRTNAFKAAITQRLLTDLGPEPISQSFFLQIMCTDTIWIIGLVLLIAGLAVLTLGICALAIPAVGTTIAGMSMSSVAITTTGAVMTTTGTGTLIGHFFSKRKWRQDNETSQKAIHSSNVIATAS